MQNLGTNSSSEATTQKGQEKQAYRSSCTMFYVNYSNNLAFSKMADQKAHILIGLNVLLLSFFITKKHLGILAHLQGYLIPNIILVVSCMVTIVLALMVARPRLPGRIRAGEPVNWLFFGSFRYHSLDEFHEAVFSMQQDKNAIYEGMSRDLYWMGLSLARKYRLLSRAYLVFLCCQLATVGSYIVVFAWNQLHT